MGTGSICPPYCVNQSGGLKVVTENGWFAARPPGTEDIDKMESFQGPARLTQIQQEAREIARLTLEGAGGQMAGWEPRRRRPVEPPFRPDRLRC
jgi:hypothetical protein